MTDHDLLIQLCEKVDLIYEMLTNHLEHHQALNIMAWGIAFTAIIALVAVVFKNKKNKKTS